MPLLRISSVLFFLLLSFHLATAQQLRESGKSRNASGNEYEFIAADEGIYTVKVVDPSGEIISMPLKKKKLASGQKIKFKLDQSNWKRGQYHIVASSREGKMVSLQMVSDEPSMQKPEKRKH